MAMASPVSEITEPSHAQLEKRAKEIGDFDTTHQKCIWEHLVYQPSCRT